MIDKGQLQINQKGQTSLEFAGIALVFLFILLATTYLGEVIFAYNWVSTASHDAVRWASVRGDSAPAAASTADVQNFVKSELNIDNSKGELVVTPTWTPDNKPGSTVQVQVQYTFKYSLPIMGTVTLPLVSTAQLVISQ